MCGRDGVGDGQDFSSNSMKGSRVYENQYELTLWRCIRHGTALEEFIM